MRKHEFHLLEFVVEITPMAEAKLAPHDAMWVTEGHEEPGARNCPDMNSTCNYDAMEPISVSPHQRRLLIHNDNADSSTGFSRSTS